jgi:hypothetical protein
MPNHSRHCGSEWLGCGDLGYSDLLRRLPDVRDDWREAILDGVDPEEATQKLLADYREILGDPDEATVFWLALAYAQHQTGRLLPDTRTRALEISRRRRGRRSLA